MLGIAYMGALAMYILVLVLYVSNRHLKTYSGGIFKKYLLFGYLNAIVTTMALRLIETEAIGLQRILQKIIMVATITMVFLLALYILYETNGKDRIKSKTVIWGLYIIGAVLSVVLKGHVKNGVLLYGYNCHIVYTICVILLGVVFITINHREKPITQKKLNILNVSIVGFITAIFIEMMTLRLCAIGIVNTIVLIFLFFEFENPSELIDKETGLFNAPAFKEYIDDLRVNDINYNLLLIDMNLHNQYHTKQLKDMISRELLKLKDGIAFKHLGNIFIVAYKNKDSLDSEYNMLCDRFKNQLKQLKLEEKYLPTYLIVEDTDCIDADMLMKFVQEFRNKNFFYNKSGQTARIEDGDFNRARHKENISKVIRTAIETDGVLIYFQPIYSVKEKKITSAEVLMRLKTVNGDILYPVSFIDVAENTGLIIELDGIVLRKVCEFIKQHPLEELGLDYLELNLSIRKGECDALVEEYKSILDKYEINPSNINLEITESASIRKKEALMKNMQSFVDYGVVFSLDDFGSGESNLNYIIDMPVELVKFDKDMTQGYFNNDKTKTVVNYTLKMIHGLGLRIVAEGVETKEQLEKMSELGVDFIQGYYFSKPVNEDDFIDYLAETKCEGNI